MSSAKHTTKTHTTHTRTQTRHTAQKKKKVIHKPRIGFINDDPLPD
jgi:hypothetical protein